MSADPSASKAQKNKKSKDSASPAEPILSGRLMIALCLIGAMVGLPFFRPLGSAITKRSPKTTNASSWQIGNSARVNLTVVSADFERLACSTDHQYQQNRCGFDSNGKEVATVSDRIVSDNHRHQLQPYRSTDGKLLLIPGLWAQPEVATRLHEEPFKDIPERRLARFVISCELSFVARWTDVKVRWKPKEKWSDQGEAMVAQAKDCAVLRSKL